MAEDLVFAEERHVGIITLQRTQALNALTLSMILALHEQLQAWQNDSSIHAVVIRSAMDRAFCAGGDVRWLYEAGRAANPDQMQFFWHEYRLNHFIHQFAKPYIALMDGITMGGGVGISLHGSHPVATENFLFAMPETGIGFFPDIGASYLLARCPGALGIYLGLTGARLGAADALAAGLVKYTVSSEFFPLILADLIETDLSFEAHEQVNTCLNHYASPAQPSSLIRTQAFIDQCFGQPDLESIMAALMSVEDEWHQATFKTLQQKAPLSLKVTLAQIQKAKTLTMADCVNMDYCLVSHFMRDPDFYEGVRALLIDKDKSPRWQPDSLAHVRPEQVAAYFKCEQNELNCA